MLGFHVVHPHQSPRPLKLPSTVAPFGHPSFAGAGGGAGGGGGGARGSSSDGGALRLSLRRAATAAAADMSRVECASEF